MDKKKAGELALRVRATTGAMDALNMREEIASAIEELAGIKASKKTKRLSKVIKEDDRETLETVEGQLEGVATPESHNGSSNNIGDAVVTEWGDTRSSYVPPLSEEKKEEEYIPKPDKPVGDDLRKPKKGKKKKVKK